MIAIRGATSIECDEPLHLAERSIELYHKITTVNSFEKVIAIILSVTPDIHSANPATILRTQYHLSDVAFMCLQEAMFQNSLPRIIRILVLGEGSGKQFVYLHAATKLREEPKNSGYE